MKNKMGFLQLSNKYLLMILIIIFVFKITGCSDENSNKEININQSPDIVTNSLELYREYKANEIAADNKYKNKLLLVVGPVEKIRKDILDKPYISLWVDKYSITGVQCFIQQSQMSVASNLANGDWVKVIGRCKGKFIGPSGFSVGRG